MLQGPPAQESLPIYTGTVTSFLPDQNCGYIDCKAVKDRVGMDVYVSVEVLARSQAGPGDLVAFCLGFSETRPEAAFPLLRLKSGVPGTFALKGIFKTTPAGGFIECAEIKNLLDRDVYVGKDLASKLEAGSLVSVNVVLNREGKPNALEAAPCDESWAPTPGDLTQQVIIEPGQAGPAKPVGTGQFTTGRIKSFNPGNNYGFITSDDAQAVFNCDVFLHGRELAGKNLQVGDMVQFEVGLNAAGKPQAVNVQALASGSPAAAAVPQLSQ
mmetsp:Transcript_59768/g.107320  ORF Transcript_59768/g.107320 Transcript_59768/m.107320 type:complete len:270 (+) Transcript_59768:1-810(+)